jgi:hypothetical protein
MTSEALLSTKDTVKRMERQATDWEKKVCRNDVFDKKIHI